MEEQFVTSAIAVKLVDLGFNESCFKHYFFPDPQIPKIEQKGILVDNGSDCNNTQHFVKAPLWQQAFWFIKEKFKESNGFGAEFWIFSTDEEVYLQFIKYCKAD